MESNIRNIIECLNSIFNDMVIIYMIKYFGSREIKITKRTWIVCCIFEIIDSILSMTKGDEYTGIISVIFILIILVYAYKIKFYKKILLSFVVFLIDFIICITLLIVVSTFFSTQLFIQEEAWAENIDNLLNIIGIFVCVVIIVYITKKTKENINLLISKLDIFILLTTSIISFVLLMVMEGLKQKVIYGETIDKLMIMFFGACGIIMNISIAVSLIKSKSAYYYKNMNEINEHYMEMQLNHFEAYKNSQKETRRIKHDMKNHIICISELLDKNRIEEVKEYIKDLKESIASIDINFKTGNIILDSIINEKYSYMKEKNINLKIDGYINEEITVQPVDICTIFANAIDNAIEGSLKEADENKRYIKIFIKENRNFIFISLLNNMVMVKNSGKNRFSTIKKDNVNHGFGIYNIKHAVDKYQGNVDMEAKENMFKVNIVLPK